MYRACELSSGRRRHWKNRTEINRSVFFAELEHRFPPSSSFFRTFLLSCPIAVSLAPSLVSPSSSHFVLPSLLPPTPPPPSPPPPLPPFAGFSFSTVPSFSTLLLLLTHTHTHTHIHTLLVYFSFYLAASAFLPLSLFEFTVLLPDRPGRLRRTFHVNWTFSLALCPVLFLRLEYISFLVGECSRET